MRSLCSSSNYCIRIASINGNIHQIGVWLQTGIYRFPCCAAISRFRITPTCSFINTAGYIRVHCHGMAVKLGMLLDCHTMTMHPDDCHTMTMHPDVTGRIYEAAGGGVKLG